jgi:IS1 family transposase
MAWGLGGRDAATFKRLDDKRKPFTECLFYPDNGDAFAQVLPQERHRIGNAHTPAMERDHAHTRHHLARMTRRTTVVATSADLLHASVTRWCARNVPIIFEAYRALFLAIFN